MSDYPGDSARPPLGIMPERQWKANRAWDLIECLARHSSQEYIPDEWFSELRRLLNEQLFLEENNRVNLLLAAILLGRNEPLAPHHVNCIREMLGERSDAELSDFVRTGPWPKEDNR